MQPGGKSISQAFLPCKGSGSTCASRKIQDVPCRIHMQHPMKVESVHSLVPMPQASPRAEQWEAQSEVRAVRSSSVLPSLPLLQSWSLAGAILLLLPPIYRDDRRRQVTAAVPSRPRSFPSHVPVTIPFLPSPPLPKGWMPSSAGAWVGGYPKTTLQGPIPPRDLGTAQCSSPGHWHQLAKLSPEQHVALPTVAWQRPHRSHRTCCPQQPPRGPCSPRQPPHRPHRTCSHAEEGATEQQVVVTGQCQLVPPCL